MDGRIAVASTSLGPGFAGLMYSQIKRSLPPGMELVECAAPQNGPDIARARMLAMLEGDPPPLALVGVCLRPDEETLAAYRARNVPVLLIDEEMEGATTVAFDSVAGGYIAGQHLARAGRRTIAVVAGRMGVNGGYNAVQRVSGFRKAMTEAGLHFEVKDVIEVRDYTHRDGVNALNQLCDEPRKFDAVFSAAGDATAAGIMAAARDRRIEVPRQLAVLGYDDSPMAAISSPPLTTIRQSVEVLAAEVLRLATTDHAELLARPTARLLPPTLVKRESA